MRINELEAGNISWIELVPENKSEKFSFSVKEYECRLERKGSLCELIVQEERILVKGKDSRHKVLLENIFKTKIPRLFWIVSFSEQHISVQIHEFIKGYDLSSDSIEIGINDNIDDTVRKAFGKEGSANVIGWLKDELLLKTYNPNEGTVRLFISADSGNNPAVKNNPFRIYGRKINIDVEFDRKREIYSISRIIRIRNNQKRSVQKLQIKVEFKDESEVLKLRESVKQELNAITSQTGSYIRLWEEYNVIEKKKILEKAAKAGFARYEWYENVEDGYKFSLSGSFEEWLKSIRIFLKEEGSLVISASEDIPDFSDLSDTEGKSSRKRNEFIGRLERGGDNNKSIILKDEDEEKERSIPKQGYLSLSVKGDKVRLKRREKAIEIIRSGNAPISYISLFLEEKAEIPKSQYASLEPMTSEMTYAGFENLNSLQQQALKIALNTPDIALIQGPPGTGKTQVISALCTRIAEESRKNNEPVQNLILITSFQHDAVSNASERIQVLGLPSVKIGKKGKEEGFFSDSLKRWIKEKKEIVRANLSLMHEPSVSLALKKLRDLYISYIQSPQISGEKAAEMMRQIKGVSINFLPGIVIDKINSVVEKLKKPEIKENESQDLILRAARGIRTESVSYEDDGQIAVGKLLKRTEDTSVLKEEEELFLRNLYDRTDAPSTEEFQKLKEIQDSLLDRLNISNVPKDREFANEDIVNIFVEIINILEEQRKNSKDSLIFPLNEFLEELENNPVYLKDSITYYTSVLASTVQKSDDIRIYNLRKNDSELIEEFNTVIVDEAARANPLDLMIPLTKAKKRIILVGDHRQLPHILEPDIESEILNSEILNNEELLKKSLFERLFKRLKALEDKDCIPRNVTLNVQYRMHPVIGNFISRTFYEKNGDAEVLPGKGCEELVHNFSRFRDRQVVWRDIPNFRGGEEKKYGSFRRQIEAREIAILLSELAMPSPIYWIEINYFKVIKNLFPETIY